MTLSRWRALLGYGGLLPFVALAVLVWVVPRPLAHALVSAQLAYGALILGFVGAVHWGRSLSTRPAAGVAALVWSVLPSLWAWVALLAGAPVGLPLLAAGLALAWALDRWVFYAADRDSDWQPGFLRLRGRLSAVAVACLLATFVSPAAI